MYQKNRLDKLMEIISAKKTISVNELIKKAYTSRSTLRRDLIKLEKESKITRSFGQVEYVGGQNTEFGYEVRIKYHDKEKAYMAELASDFIGDGQAIFIDSSTTCMHLVPFLKKKKNLIVITNGIYLGAELASMPNIKTFICGGRIRSMSGSILGNAPIEYMNNFRANLVFLSCEGIDERGIYMASEEQSLAKRAMLKSADQTILMCDSSKVNKSDYFRMCAFSDIDTVITDKKLPADLESKLESENTEVLY